MCDVLDADPDVYQGFGVRYLFLVTSATFGVIEIEKQKLKKIATTATTTQVQVSINTTVH